MKKLLFLLTAFTFPLLLKAQGIIELSGKAPENHPFLLSHLSQSKNSTPVVLSSALSGFYREDFDGSTFPPAGWQLIDVLNPNYSWFPAGLFPYLGPQSTAIPYGASPGEDWLILPKFTVASGDSIAFHLALFNGSGGGPDSTFVLVSTTDSAITSFTNVVATLTDGLNYPLTTFDYQYYSYSLSAFAGSDVFVAIVNKNTNGHGMFLDRVDIGTKSAVNVLPVNYSIHAFLPSNTSITPTAKILNDGYTTQSFPVTMTITGGYSSVKNITNLAPGAMQDVTFDPYTTAVTGTTETVSVQTQLLGDLESSNDSLASEVNFLEGFTNYGWASRANLPEFKHGVPMASINSNDTSHFIAVGGGSTIPYSSVAHEYLPYSNSWAAIPDMPSGTAYAAGATYNNKAFIISGYTDPGTMNNDNRIYDLATNSWTLGATIPTAKGFYAIGVYQDSLIYCMGGQNGSMALNSVYIYNAASDSWSTGTSLPGYCSSCSGGILGNKVVVANGIDGTFVGTINPNNPNAISWIVGPDYPLAGVWGLGGAATLDQASGLIVFTAGATNFTSPFDFSEYTFAYDVNTDQWKVGPPKPTPVFDAYLTAVVDNDSLYLVSVGGWGASSTKRVNEWLNLGPYVIPTAVADNDPVKISFKCSPNPFVNVTNIHFSLTKTSEAKAVITDVLGKEVDVLNNAIMQAGKHHLQWDASTYNSGIYFCKITVDGVPVTQKLVKY